MSVRRAWVISREPSEERGRRLHKTPLIRKWFWPRRDVHLTMRIEINYQAETLETAVCEAIVTYLGYGMPACEIIDQLISRGFIRDPGE